MILNFTVKVIANFVQAVNSPLQLLGGEAGNFLTGIKR